GEIFFDKLLSSLMKTLIESAGAQLGYLILSKNEEMLIEAAGNTEKITVLQSIKITNNLPETVINYVLRTLETVVENDAYSQGKFTNDPYIKNQKSKSILCAPLLKHSQLIGLIYLENNLIAGAFTQDRLEVIKLLSSQAAISIENAQLYANLETKVEERTQELQHTLTHLQATQQELIQSEKMAALGQLIAGVAHEINTPLGAIRSSIENIADFLDKNIFNLPEFFQQIPAEYQEYFLALLQAVQPVSNLSTKEKRQFKRALIKQLEAEEIDDYDTIADILVDLGIYEDVTAFLPLLKIKNSIDIVNIAYQLASLQKSSATIKTATDRAAKIVFALKNYARYDHSGNPMLFKITDGIETVLILYQNQLKQGVEISKNYGENLPDIMGYPDELNQVWTNLIHNSLQAMKNKGNLMIDVQKQAENIAISITDSGTGIPPEILPRIFEPFFTTKPPGEGSGLGLDIVKKIIDKHCGKISVESSPGQTTFTVLIPINSLKL
ncbi:MAG TPA: ATP-binding protein, partial [Allocoleopsis sp.]